MPVEGRDLSSRRTQHVVRDLEIGEPINSEECSETAEGVARESEGRSRLPFLCPVRQDQPRGHPGSRLRPVFGSQEVGKLSVPSFSSCCWTKAPEASAAVIRPAAHSVRRDCLFIARSFGWPIRAVMAG